MNAAFKPLLPAGSAEPTPRLSFTAKVLRQPATVASFQPASRACTAPASPANHQPRVTLERQGDRISRILITCACGEVIELDCRY